MLDINDGIFTHICDWCGKKVPTHYATELPHEWCGLGITGRLPDHLRGCNSDCRYSLLLRYKPLLLRVHINDGGREFACVLDYVHPVVKTKVGVAGKLQEFIYNHNGDTLIESPDRRMLDDWTPELAER